MGSSQICCALSNHHFDSSYQSPDENRPGGKILLDAGNSVGDYSRNIGFYGNLKDGYKT